MSLTTDTLMVDNFREFDLEEAVAQSESRLDTAQLDSYVQQTKGILDRLTDAKKDSDITDGVPMTHGIGQVLESA